MLENFLMNTVEDAYYWSYSSVCRGTHSQEQKEFLDYKLVPH